MPAITVTEKKVAPVLATKCIIRPHRVGVGGVVAGNAVVPDATSGRVIKASANTTGAKGYGGTAMATKGEGEVVDVLEDGWWDGADVSALAYGALVYLSNTAGGLDTAAGTTSIVIGKVVPLSDRDPATGKPSKIVRTRASVVDALT